MLSWTPNDPRFAEQWDYNNTGQQGGTPGADISMPEAWDLCKGNPSVIVAVIDGGIDIVHPDLSPNLWSGIGYNFVDDSPTVTAHFHGTHVAGTVAASTNNATGVAGIAGGSGSGNGVRLMSCQVFTNSSSGGFENAFIWAADHGAAISQNSWIYSVAGEYDLVVLEAIDYFNVNGGGQVLNGGLTVFAAGNNNSSGQYYPACYSGTYAVAGTNNQDKKAWYSNYASWVDIAAPGGETNPVPARGVLSTVPGNTYSFYQGTSMACPHVSGVAGLVVSLAPAQLSSQDVKTILSSTADNIDAVNPTYIGMLGSGRLNAYAALQMTQTYLNPSVPLPPQALNAQTINTSQISLSWTPNTSYDSVLLAFNTENVFGTPSGNLLPGQPVPGGGTVLYAGQAVFYDHLGLNPGTIYFYSLWSRADGIYSVVSIRARDTTWCDAISSLPYLQDFESSEMMPSCWTQEAYLPTWWFFQGNGSGHPDTAHSGIRNACFLDVSQQPNLNKLITPVFDMTNYTDLQLSFWHTQEVWGSDQDELRIYYRNSPGGAWTLLQTYQQNIPSWIEEIVPLPAGTSYYQVAFEGNARYGYGVCVDDVEITGTFVPTLGVVPPNQDVGPSAGSTTFTVTSNTDWTVTSDSPWCMPTPSGTGNGIIIADYTENISVDPRIASLTVTVSGLPPVVVTVTQAGAAPTLNVTPPNQDVTADAGITTFSVTSNTDWAVTSDSPWCVPTPSGTGNGDIDAAYEENTTYTQRVASLTVTVLGLVPSVVTVTQAASVVGVPGSMQSTLRIYPNPNDGSFRILTGFSKSKTLEVSVLNMTGQPVMTRECSGEEEYRFDLSRIPEGCYFVKVRYDEGVKVMRMVISR
jgi:hypothetical protein